MHVRTCMSAVYDPLDIKLKDKAIKYMYTGNFPRISLELTNESARTIPNKHIHSLYELDR